MNIGDKGTKELIKQTTKHDWTMVQWAQADALSGKHSLRLPDSDLCLLLAGESLLSDDTIFHNLRNTKRLYRDAYELKPKLYLYKERGSDELLDLFSADVQQSVYQEFVFYCERRTYFLKCVQEIIRRIYAILGAYDKNRVLNRMERGVYDKANKIIELCGDGIDQVGKLLASYHAHTNIVNDEQYNEKGVPHYDNFSLKESLLFGFMHLNQPERFVDREEYGTIDAAIKEFFITITSDPVGNKYFGRLLASKAPIGRQGLSPLTKKEIQFVRAFEFLK